MFNKITMKNSSFIKGFSYVNGELEMNFKSGNYTYDVSEDVFIGLLFAESKGKFYNQNIKKKAA